MEDLVSKSSKQVFTETGNKALRTLGYDEEQVERTYKPGKIFVGWNRGDQQMLKEIFQKKLVQFKQDADKAKNAAWIEFRDNIGEKKEPVFIDRREADLAFWGGERGAGKTFHLRSETNRESKGGAKCFIVDPEHEYYTNNKKTGIQKKLENLGEDERRQPVDSVVLMPYFVWKSRKENDLPEHGYQYDEFRKFKFNFSDLKPEDLEFMIKQHLGTKKDYKSFITAIHQRARGGEGFSSWDDFKEVADDLQDDPEGFQWDGRASEIKSFFENNYERYGFLGRKGGRYSVDFGELYEDYDTVILSLYDDNNLPRSLMMKELYVSFALKNLRSAVQRKALSPPVSVTVDEAHRYVPAGMSGHVSRRQIKRIVKRDRKRGFRVNLASQEPTDVDTKNILNQLRHIFIPQSMSRNSRKVLMDLGGVRRRGDSASNKWDYIFNSRRIGKYWWFYVDRRANRNKWCVLEPASPLANHFEGG